MLPVVLAFFVVVALGGGASTASASPLGDEESAEILATQVASSTVVARTENMAKLTSTPMPGSPTSTARPVSVAWEREALRDVATALGWPTSVRVESSGRMSVQKSVSASEWTLAFVRPFEFAAGAQAAYTAAQQDARLGGYRITVERLDSYPAYYAVLEATSGQGQVVERRLHWLSGRWMMGIETRGGKLDDSELQRLARGLLASSLSYGLPHNTAQTPTRPALASPPTATVITESPESCDHTFSDVKDSNWAYSYIHRLACEGIVSGYSDSSFRPQSATTRAQVLKMVVLLQGWPLETPRVPTYKDVGAAHPFYRYIETATARGVATGYSDDTFAPDDFVTRAQVAKVIVLAKNWPRPLTAPVPPRDVPPAHWASDYVQTVLARGIFSGYEGGEFQPDAKATRAQLAKVFVLAFRASSR